MLDDGGLGGGWPWRVEQRRGVALEGLLAAERRDELSEWRCQLELLESGGGQLKWA